MSPMGVSPMEGSPWEGESHVGKSPMRDLTHGDPPMGRITPPLRTSHAQADTRMPALMASQAKCDQSSVFSRTYYKFAARIMLFFLFPRKPRILDDEIMGKFVSNRNKQLVLLCRENSIISCTYSYKTSKKD